MSEIVRISYPVSESWVAWVLLSLLMAVLIANQRQSGLIKGAWAAMVHAEDRRYHEMAHDSFQWLLTGYFSAGVPSLLLYAVFFHSTPCEAWRWLVVLLIWCAMEGLKYATMLLVRYVFGLEKVLANMDQQYADMRLITGLVLYPITALVCYVGAPIWVVIPVYLSVTFLFVVLLSKAFRTLPLTPMSVVYILLYFLTLEVIPLGIVCRLVKMIS